MSSELRVNILRGSTANGNITIQGEGASNLGGATMQLQQGLCKAWFEFTSITSTTMTDSFNCSVTTDNGTGDTLLSFTNNMNSSAYVVNAADVSYDAAFNTSVGNVIESTQNSKVKTSSTFIVLYTAHSGVSVLDHCEQMGTVHGDLA